MKTRIVFLMTLLVYWTVLEATSYTKWTDSRIPGPQTTDQDILSRIQDSLQRSYLYSKFSDVSIDVSYGAVTLRGTVENSTVHQELKNRVLQVFGVKSIDDRVTVGQ